ncbi:MAG TPA: hydantoinase B/oxoprolinase family protein [Falsiroseomonas sp.]|jgi:N-methylhydantoinase B|nr:hydantoinase B/oxoprolinase family protein [Falsiroseomonas sp.]
MLDPVTLEVLGRKVTAAAEGMGFTLQRTGRTLYVKEASDFGTALVGLDGRFFGYPRTIGVSHFLDLDCSATIRAVPDLEPGDVILTNHPYASEALSTHLPDLHLVRPYFHEGRIVAYGWCFVHSADIGGRVPSSISPSNTDLFQEGLMIPPMKLVRRGELNPDVVTLYCANVRTPEQNMGDIRAELASLHVGGQRVAEMIASHGVDTFIEAQEALQDYADRKARAVLARIPDGEYEFWDYLDDDMVSTFPVRIRLTLRKRGGEIELDFDGTDPQVATAYNIPTMGRRHAWFTARIIGCVSTHDPSIPMNAGVYRCITAKARPGSVVHAEPPAAVGVRQPGGRRIFDMITGALLKGDPTLMAAASGGVSTPVVLAEEETSQGDRNVVVLEPMIGGMGARAGHDGVDGRDSGTSNLANNPIESIEAAAPILVRNYAVRADSGGPGRWRGGCGLEFSFEVLRDGCTVLARGMERCRFPPWGAMGGRPGLPFRVILNRDTPKEEVVGKIDLLEVEVGDVVTILTPGAGGYGDPFLRDPEAVRVDVRLGVVSAAAAAADYGVVIRDGVVDHAGTARLRAAPRLPRDANGFDFGAERDAYETVFTDEAQTRLNAALFEKPKRQRSKLRRRVMEAAVPDMPRAGHRPLVEVLADPAAARARFEAAFAELLR